MALAVEPVDDSQTDAPSTFISVFKIVLGATHPAAGRPAGASAPETRPGTHAACRMSAVDAMVTVKAGGLGALLAAVNPKKPTLCLAGGVTIGSGGLPTGETTVAPVFVTIAWCSIAVPWVSLVAADRSPASARGDAVVARARDPGHVRVAPGHRHLAILGQGVAGL